MNISDPIADMLTRVRNASRARHTGGARAPRRAPSVRSPHPQGGGLHRRRPRGARRGCAAPRLELKYVDGKVPVVSGLKRISKPGLRVYARKTEIPRVLGGLGVVIVSTSQGIMTGSRRARPAGRRSPRLRLVGGTMSRIGRLPIAVPRASTSRRRADHHRQGPQGHPEPRAPPGSWSSAARTVSSSSPGPRRTSSTSSSTA
jgi:small subunit ribosomal protein S8